MVLLVFLTSLSPPGPAALCRYLLGPGSVDRQGMKSHTITIPLITPLHSIISYNQGIKAKNLVKSEGNHTSHFENIPLSVEETNGLGTNLIYKRN